MGTLIGHVAPGFGFLLIGLWHLFKHCKLQARHPPSYFSSPWFPAPFVRHLELYLIILGSCVSISMELFIGPEKHQPFDPDGTIPSNHLHNFEHSSISFSFLIYAAVALIFDRVKPLLEFELVQLLAAMAFGQQLLLFRLHSADHMGVEGQYHLLLQLAIIVTFLTTLIGILQPSSFLTSFVRSLSIVFQGMWLILMGLMLWTTQLIPKGCWLNSEQGHQVVRCHDEFSLHRAKSLVNLQFSWLLSALSIFAMVMYLVLLNVYGEKTTYTSIGLKDVEEEDTDLESPKTQKRDGSKSFLHMGTVSFTRDIER